MKFTGMILAAALLAPAALVAQQQPQGPGPRGPRPTAIAIAIDHKADLGLTEDQVTKLTAIQKALEEKNAPIRQKMQEARGGMDFQTMTPEQRQAMREKAMPLMQQMRANNDAARTDMEKLLKPDQITKLQHVLQAEMPQRPPRPNP